jgi:hypothetical protein
MKCLDSGYILGQYMNIKYNLLYRTWTAGLRMRRRRRRRLLKKRQNQKKTCEIKTYIYEGRLKSSWTGGSAPLLCRGRR